MRVHERGGVGILYTFGRGVSGFFTLVIEWLHFWNDYPLDGWFTVAISPIARLARAKVGHIPPKGNGGLATPQGVYALIDWVNFKGEGTDIS